MPAHRRDPHLGISARLDHFCDGASFVDWELGQPRFAGLADLLAPPHPLPARRQNSPTLQRKPVS